MYGKEFEKNVTCPFCGMPVEKPKELTTRRWGEMPVGSCSCGAVYACDETGHNLGSAMIEALMFGCNMDSDLAWGLLPYDDYLEEIVEHYDYINHRIVPGGFLDKRRISGALYFIRLHDDVQEVTADGVKQQLDKTESLLSRTETNNEKKKPLTKKMVEQYVRDFEISPILDVAGEDKKIIRNLQRLLYSGDDQFRKRAAETLGMVSSIIAEKNPGAISKLLQRLFTSIIDSAASSWGAFEAIGEIISHKADMFAGYIPQLYQFLPDQERRPQVLEALGRIASSNPDLINKVAVYAISLLNAPESLIRGYSVWLLGNLGASEARDDIEMLCDDMEIIEIYEDGHLNQKTVAQLASEALEKF